jgi:hypothetical protein
MPFKKGQSGNPLGRAKKRPKVLGVLERAMPRIENEIQSATPEVARELVIALAGVVTHQIKNNGKI